MKQLARAPSGLGDDSETDSEEDTSTRPAPEHVIMLCAQVRGNRGRFCFGALNRYLCVCVSECVYTSLCACVSECVCACVYE